MQFTDFSNVVNKLNTPITSNNLTKNFDDATQNIDGVTPFKSVFEQAVGNVITTSNEVQENAYLLATGQSDNLHDLTIDSTQAELAVSLLVELRNRAMDAYSEIMRINL